jgi:hypothetical protein
VATQQAKHSQGTASRDTSTLRNKRERTHCRHATGQVLRSCEGRVGRARDSAPGQAIAAGGTAGRPRRHSELQGAGDGEGDTEVAAGNVRDLPRGEQAERGAGEMQVTGESPPGAATALPSDTWCTSLVWVAQGTVTIRMPRAAHTVLNETHVDTGGGKGWGR